jgi:hypothetical protein
MCESGGINNDQMKLSIAQCNEAVGLAQEWLEQLHHLLDHAGESASSALVAQVTVALGEAREKLDGAADAVGTGGHDHVSVELV